MSPVFRITVLLALVTVADHSRLQAQGTREDYERANSWRRTTSGKVFRSEVRPHWLQEASKMWYRVQMGADKHEFVMVDLDTGERQAAFDHAALAEALATSSEEATDADALPIRSLEFSATGDEFEFTAHGRRWTWALQSQQIAESQSDGAEQSTALVLTTPRRSRRTGAETSIRFLNNLSSEATLYWLDTSGGRTAYGTVAAGQERDQHTFAGHVWLGEDSEGKLLGVFEATDDPSVAIFSNETQARPPSRPLRRRGRGNRTSPDGKWRAIIQDHNLFLRNTESGESTQLSNTGTDEDRFLARCYWSPDSTKLVAIQEKQGENRTVHFVESAPDDQLQPKLHSFRYDKPGDRLPVPRPRLFDVAEMRQIDISEELLPQPWSVSDFRWQDDSSRFTFLYNQRGHQVLRLIAVDASTGEAGTLIEEASDTFVDYTNKVFQRHLPNTNEILWMSELDGWCHLYLYDAQTGQLKNQVTRGNWIVRDVERVDPEQRQVWFWAGGVFPEQDPYYRHLCRVNFDGSGFQVLTEGNGTHSVEFAPDGKHFVDTYSRVDLAPVNALRSSEDGRLVSPLERGDWSQLEASQWHPPERFVAKGRDDETDIYGIIHRPSNFDPEQKYPVIEKIYAGPQGAFVPKRFSAYHDAQALAELGFIVVQIDGMGTSHRSKAFHDVCWQNLGDSGFPDRIEWLRAAAEKYPEFDLERVGIYGGSAGGQSALRALLAHGDFYDAAIADCGCHDNRMDKVWWNEQWMGWPLGDHYREQSNVTQAHKLAGKLLLMVGELDRNVDPASTMQVVDALIKADKDFDLLVVPGGGHGAGGGRYGTRRSRDFFVRHLLGVEPRAEQPVE